MDESSLPEITTDFLGLVLLQYYFFPIQVIVSKTQNNMFSFKPT